MTQTDVQKQPTPLTIADLENMLLYGQNSDDPKGEGDFGVNASKNARHGVNATPKPIGVKKDKRTRKEFRFWLDLESAFEAGIANVLTNWRMMRLMETSIVQALRLYIACENGQYETLFDMYPDLREMCGKKRRR